MKVDSILGAGCLRRLSDGREVVIRAARGGDEPLIQAFIGGLSLASRYQRFFLALHELSAPVLEHIVRGDAHSEAALLALTAQGEVVGLVQYVGPETLERAEVAVVVADAWRRVRVGLGAQLLMHLERVATAAGVEHVEADILRDNIAAIQLASKLGARVGKSPNGGGLVRVVRQLAAATEGVDLVSFRRIFPVQKILSKRLP
jgi:acetyltransferase